MNEKHILRHPAVPYVLPFAVFLLLTEISSWFPASISLLYPLKTILVGFLLVIFWRSFPEIKPKGSFFAVVVGILVFVLWILPEGYYPLLCKSKAFNPYQLPSQGLTSLWIAFRLLGTAIVVPVMEELFWRSFLIRFLINKDFRKVQIGAFTWFSFCSTVILFGAEHQRWLVGIIAGIIYNLLLHYKKDLYPCIIAHAVTNLTLGVYVLMTHQWGYW